MSVHNPWQLVYEDYDPDQEGLREALCTLGNGAFATRGAAPEGPADDVHYPGTYIGGLYNRLDTEVAGRTITNEDLVNVPNWVLTRIRIGEGDWVTLDNTEVLDYRQELDLRRGVLVRRATVRDADGRETCITHRRFVSMAVANMAAQETTVMPVNWSGTLTVCPALDGTVINAGVARYRSLSSQHLEVLDTGVEQDEAWLRVRTSQSRVELAEAARMRSWVDGRAATPETAGLDGGDGLVGLEMSIPLQEQQEFTVEKVVAVVTSRDRAIAAPLTGARTMVRRAAGFDDLLEQHILAMDHLWDRFRLDVDRSLDGRESQVLNLHLFHLLQTCGVPILDRDVGVPARGLHGEAYRGHIFWDELFILPLLNLHLPILTRSLLLYRRRRLHAARDAARQAGYRGAMYPWQSGSDGSEESQVVHLNPKSGRWVPDNSHRQRHINIAIAYNVWHYYETTGDEQFLRFHGAEMLLEIARFWSSLATYNHASDRYEIHGVMGPDEYHEGYPGAEEDDKGLRNNAYTNVMVVWVLLRALEVFEVLSTHHADELRELLGLHREELDRWGDITRKMVVPFHDGVISQFEGYGELKELDWDGYREKYGNIQRLDRILEAEGDTPDAYKLSKQADVLMLFYLLGVDQVEELFRRLGYDLDQSMIDRTIDYYLARTAHGSTLSKVVHSWVLSRRDPRRAQVLFGEALQADVADVQGGTTKEGIHLGAMAGTVDLVQRAWTGLAVRKGVLYLDPVLPEDLKQMHFSIHVRGHRLQVEIDHESVLVRSRPTDADPLPVVCGGHEQLLEPGSSLSLALPEQPDR